MFNRCNKSYECCYCRCCKCRCHCCCSMCHCCRNCCRCNNDDYSQNSLNTTKCQENEIFYTDNNF